LNLSTKVKAFEKEIKRESDLIGDILFVKDMFERTESGPSFKGWPEAQIKKWFDEAHVRGYTLRHKVCDFEDERDRLHDKLGELIGEVLEKGELRRPDDPAWVAELESSRVVEYDGDTFHAIQRQ